MLKGPTVIGFNCCGTVSPPFVAMVLIALVLYMHAIRVILSGEVK
jgi:hypothetical protein